MNRSPEPWTYREPRCSSRGGASPLDRIRAGRSTEAALDIVLDFERPLLELHKRIAQLRALEGEDGVNLSASIEQLEAQALKLQERIFTRLSPWQRTQLSRHPKRPYTLDYVKDLCTEWLELHGDRAGHDDHALITGTARFQGRPVAILGHQKGRNTKENLDRNFGMARPEGYRKALRIMHLAERFSMPILCFIDTPGAFPGIDAEERGQAEAIARNILEMSRLTVPIFAVVIGEGGSGGALAIGVANRVVMMENSVYSVISPEGCAAILWRDRAEGPRAAEALKITAKDCLSLGVIDEVVPEPAGGAHRHPEQAIRTLGECLARHLEQLRELEPEEIRADRYDRFRKLGAFTQIQASA
ncbi:MAG: acetyl-CoA carboxylase carboxyltransferase subunit alpha [Deltaproteobacteria bacterium]|nr:MAG: acetyl-CoA carboxylase carboxyltransferase subunit alpha [Deltaproteobacteria bacterium]